MTINVHAAANAGRYYGTDFNPAHAAHANELCQASGSDAQLFEDSFEQFLARDDLPQFDSIGLHGIWSWITIDNQRQIVEFIRRHLKSGGVVYNSYNCFPGWAPNAPLREILVCYDQYLGNLESNTAKRVDNALNFADEMLKANPIYARRVPEIKAKLESLKSSDHDYLAHEYFDRNWLCTYFSEVADIMSAAKLNFGCTAVPLDGIDSVNLTADAQKFLNSIGNPIAREQMRDYFVNQQFRKDLYVRGARRMSEAERQSRLLETPFVLTTVGKVELKFGTVLGQVALSNASLEPMLEHLRADGYRPKTFAELMRRREITFAGLEQVLMVLVNNNVMLPCQDEETIERVQARCDALNDYICRQAETTPRLNVLASPVTGAGYPIGQIHQLMTARVKRGLTSVEEIARSMWQLFEAKGHRLMIPQKSLTTPEENIAELERLATEFVENQLPILRALRIV